MNETALSFRPEAQDSNAFVIALIVMVLVFGVWFIVKKKTEGAFFKDSNGIKGNDIQVISQQYLPRGGLLVQVMIGDKLVYLLESNKTYTQIDPATGLQWENAVNLKDE
jgi:hypothetical protein